MLIRHYQPGEEMALLALFQSSVLELAARDYLAEQIDAWAPQAFTDVMRAEWKTRIRANNPWVAEVDGALAGFADLQANGYIDQFFVAPAHAGQGVGSPLMRHLQQAAISQGITRLYAHVSLTAQPFFAHHEFLIEEERLPTIRGVGLRNALMSKYLSTSSGIHIP